MTYGLSESLDDGIAPRAPQVSFTTTLTSVPRSEWKGGVQFEPEGCTPAASWPGGFNCPTPQDLIDGKCEPDYQDNAEFKWWPIYLPEGCDRDTGLEDEYQGRADSALDAYTAGELSREFESGTFSGNPALETTATLIPGAAVGIAQAMSQLLRNRINVGMVGRHVYHMPAWMVAFAVKCRQVQRVGATLQTITGDLVVPGPGYNGQGANLETFPGSGIPAPAPALNESYIYITGSVEYSLGDVVPLTDGMNSQSLRRNMTEVWAERMANYRFAPCHVFAALALAEEV